MGHSQLNRAPLPDLPTGHIQVHRLLFQTQHERLCVKLFMKAHVGGGVAQAVLQMHVQGPTELGLLALQRCDRTSLSSLCASR